MSSYTDVRVSVGPMSSYKCSPRAWSSSGSRPTLQYSAWPGPGPILVTWCVFLPGQHSSKAGPWWRGRAAYTAQQGSQQGAGGAGAGPGAAGAGASGARSSTRRGREERAPLNTSSRAGAGSSAAQPRRRNQRPGAARYTAPQCSARPRAAAALTAQSGLRSGRRQVGACGRGTRWPSADPQRTAATGLVPGLLTPRGGQSSLLSSRHSEQSADVSRSPLSADVVLCRAPESVSSPAAEKSDHRAVGDCGSAGGHGGLMRCEMRLERSQDGCRKEVVVVVRACMRGCVVVEASPCRRVSTSEAMPVPLTASTGQMKGGWMLAKHGDHTACLLEMNAQPSMGEFHVMKCSQAVPSSRHESRARMDSHTPTSVRHIDTLGFPVRAMAAYLGDLLRGVHHVPLGVGEHVTVLVVAQREAEVLLLELGALHHVQPLEDEFGGLLGLLRRALQQGVGAVRHDLSKLENGDQAPLLFAHKPREVLARTFQADRTLQADLMEYLSIGIEQWPAQHWRLCLSPDLAMDLSMPTASHRPVPDGATLRVLAAFSRTGPCKRAKCTKNGHFPRISR
ncbi:Valine--tRNA ligase [Frankliniella fusca]|uniref:Valine--tRNA ligase n=1 Tax=Frankliniella fusca TaxID=407009 RepID=A0AAE1HYP3_9NEOP|nr:Valine--tRNA ligase [Frankliniella fusca]